MLRLTFGTQLGPRVRKGIYGYENDPAVWNERRYER